MYAALFNHLREKQLTHVEIGCISRSCTGHGPHAPDGATRQAGVVGGVRVFSAGRPPIFKLHAFLVSPNLIAMCYGVIAATDNFAPAVDLLESFQLIDYLSMRRT
jgi:hypothetical protein